MDLSDNATHGGSAATHNTAAAQALAAAAAAAASRPPLAATRAATAAAAAAAHAAAEAERNSGGSLGTYGGSGGGGEGGSRGGGGSRSQDARREKNRLAAKRCRDRKNAHLMMMEAELLRQQRTNEALAQHVETLVGLYQQERKQKLAARSLLHTLARAIACGPLDSPTALTPSAPASAASDGDAPPSPVLCNRKSLADMVLNLEQGLGPQDDVDAWACELRALRQALLAAAPSSGGGGSGGSSNGSGGGEQLYTHPLLLQYSH